MSSASEAPVPPEILPSFMLSIVRTDGSYVRANSQPVIPGSGIFAFTLMAICSPATAETLSTARSTAEEESAALTDETAAKAAEERSPRDKANEIIFLVFMIYHILPVNDRQLLLFHKI